MKNKLQKIAPAWHGEAKKLLAENFAKINSAFLDSTKRAVWLGIFLNHIKDKGKADGSIPHGMFGPWLKENLTDVPWDRANEYMRIGREVCEKGKFQIRDFPQFAASGNLPSQILQLVEGKTQKQLFLEFKQVEMGEDGEFRVKRGRAKGSNGNPKHVRDAGKFRNEQERLDALKLKMDEVSDWLDENLNLKGFPKVDEVKGGAKTLATFAAKISHANSFLINLNKGLES
jgi:hypothetical protein